MGSCVALNRTKQEEHSVVSNQVPDEPQVSTPSTANAHGPTDPADTKTDEEQQTPANTHGPPYHSKLYSLDSLSAIKECVADCFLSHILAQIDRQRDYIIPLQVVKLCASYSSNPHFTMLSLWFVMNECKQPGQSQALWHLIQKGMRITHVNEERIPASLRNEYVITNSDMIYVFNNIQHISVIGKCERMLIVVLNDINQQMSDFTKRRISFAHGYRGGDIYIQCGRDLRMNDMCHIQTCPPHQVGHSRMTEREDYADFEGGNLFVSVGGDIVSLDQDHLQSGKIHIYCRGDLQMKRASYITSYGHGTYIECNNMMTCAAIDAYNGDLEIRCERLFELANAYIHADKQLSVVCSEKKITSTWLEYYCIEQKFKLKQECIKVVPEI